MRPDGERDEYLLQKGIEDLTCNADFHRALHFASRNYHPDHALWSDGHHGEWE